MKSFFNGHPQDKRTISIEVDKDFISFYFDDVLRWHNQISRQNKELGYEEEELEPPQTMYWIPTDEWIKDNGHWSNHMKRKAWFTKEMNQYINQEI